MGKFDFKVGDKVRCLDGSASGRVVSGGVYTVSYVEEPATFDGYHLINVDGGYYGLYYANRFELVEEEPTPVAATTPENLTVAQVLKLKADLQAEGERLSAELTKHYAAIDANDEDKRNAASALCGNTLAIQRVCDLLNSNNPGKEA